MNGVIKVGMIAFSVLGMMTVSSLVVDTANPPGIQTQAKRNEAKKKVARGDDKKMHALAFKMKDIDGKKQDLKQYHGNVIVMVNVASQCELTPQYEQLEAIYKKYAERGFVILAFPANNFGGQEPDPNEKIKQFCTSKFDVTFPLFSKVSVKGDDICKLYKYLTDLKADHKKGGDIEWNFGKFIIDRNGKVVDRFHPRVKPDDEKFIASIEKYLAVAIPEDSALAKKRMAENEKKDAHESKHSRRSTKIGKHDGSRIDLARTSVGPNAPLAAALDLFKLNCGEYPTDLKYLYEKPSDEKIAKKWIQCIKGSGGLKDPWGAQYRYRVPGIENTDSYDLWSAGPDGLDDTEDDITNW